MYMCTFIHVYNGADMFIVIGGQKGGTGKTTIATNIAVMRTLEGRDVYLYDLDPQRSALLWSSRRAENTDLPAVKSGQMLFDKQAVNIGAVIENELKSLRDKHQDIIVDAGGADSEELRAALLLADLVIFILGPSAYDMWTLPNLSKLVAGAESCTGSLKAKVLLNRVNTNPVVAKKQIKNCDDYLANLNNLSRFNNFLRERVAVQYISDEGMAIVEYKQTGSKASEEFKSVYKEIFNV